MFALTKQAFPMRGYLQANGGSRRLTDEEIGICTEYSTINLTSHLIDNKPKI